jgi:hypothetical protein
MGAGRCCTGCDDVIEGVLIKGQYAFTAIITAIVSDIDTESAVEERDAEDCNMGRSATIALAGYSGISYSDGPGREN